MITHLAHFNGEGDAVKQSDRLLVSAVLLIGIASAPHCNKIHRWHRDQAGLFFRQIKFFVFFFVVESHLLFLPITVAAVCD